MNHFAILANTVIMQSRTNFLGFIYLVICRKSKKESTPLIQLTRPIKILAILALARNFFEKTKYTVHQRNLEKKFQFFRVSSGGTVVSITSTAVTCQNVIEALQAFF